MTEALPAVVDAAWVREHEGEEGLVLADVRGPNAHARGHLPGSVPLVLGAPPPSSDRETVGELALEVARRLGRHGITGRERLVVYDGGDGVSAVAAAQLAELAGHPAVAVLAGGLAAWDGELETGVVEVEHVRPALEPRLEALPTRDELAARLDDPELVLLDVRRPEEFSGRSGYPCDPRQGHIPGARLLQYDRLLAGPGLPLPPELVRAVTGLPPDAEVIAYCHVGSRSALATLALRAAGYRARNYSASWHEWSRHRELPVQLGG